MTSSYVLAAQPRVGSPSPARVRALFIGALVAAVAAAVVVLGPSPLAVAGLAVAILAFSLSVVRPLPVYLGAVAGFGVVAFEPAPADILVAMAFLAVVLFHFRARVPTRLSLVLLLWFGAILASLMLNGAPPYGMVFAGITALMVVLFVLTTTLARTPNAVMRMGQALVLGTAISLAIGLIVFLAWQGSSIGELVAKQGRYKGFFKDPNVMGAQAGIVVILAVSLIRRTNGLIRMAWCGCALLALVSTILSLSRASIGAMVVGVAVQAMSVHGRRVRQALWVATLALIALWMTAQTALRIPLVDTVLVDRTQTVLQPYDQARFSTQHWALESGFHHPLGIGPGAIEPEIGVASHSLWLRTWAENGWIGAFGLLAFVVAVARAAWVARRSAVPIVSVLWIVWLMLIAQSFVIDTLHWRALWLIAGLSIASGSHLSSRSEA
jgi:hypothetical protein